MDWTCFKQFLLMGCFPALILEDVNWLFSNRVLENCGKGGLERGWGRVGEGLGRGLGRAWLFTVGTKIIADPEKCFQELTLKNH